jgi:hypothetical protein
VAKLVWRVKLVAERHPGVTTETELACIERDEDVGLAELGLRLDEAKRLTAALQAQVVPAQMAALGECPRACEACGRKLAAKDHYRARFRSLFGDVPVRVRRWFVCPCRGGAGEAKSVTALDFGGDAVAPELAYVTARYAALAPFGKVAALRPSCCRSAGRSTPARCATGRCASAPRWCRRTPPKPRTSPRRGRPARS